MIHNPFVVIPTYWQGTKERKTTADDLVFDHPTYLDGDDTLTAALESLTRTNPAFPFTVLVLSAPVHPSLESEVIERVNELIRPFQNKLHIGHFHTAVLNTIQQALKLKGYPESLLTLQGYAAIRNCQLAIPLILGADCIAAIDDDEIVPFNYSERIQTYIGTSEIDLIAGRYRYKDGGTLVHDRSQGVENAGLFLKKQRYQNMVYESIDASEGELVDTSIVLGGNMVFSRKMAMSVPFDPLITRGEDIDYMINARMAGFTCKLDKHLWIDHFPPPCEERNKLQEDVVRFLYEREKLRLSFQMDGFHGIRAEDLGPYPGFFLQDNLETEALSALRERPEHIKNASWFLTPEEVISRGLVAGSNAHTYFSFARQWPHVMNALCSDEELQSSIRHQVFS